MSRPDGLLFRLVTGQALPALPASEPVPSVDPNAPMAVGPAVAPWVAHSQAQAGIPVAPAPGLPPMMVAHQPTAPAPTLMDAALREAQGRIIAASRPSPPDTTLGAAIAPLSPGELQRVLSAGGQFLFGGEQQPSGAAPDLGPIIEAPSLLQRLQGLGRNYEPVRRAYSVLETLLPVAEAGLGGPENAAMGVGGALQAAAPIVRTAEEEQNLLRSFGRMQQYMRPEIVESLGNRIRANIAEAFKNLPPSEEWEAAARAGIAKRGWYKNSGEAIQQVFGPDTPIFTGILAAQSPRQGVAENLNMAIRTYGEWIAAGRPMDEDGILRVLEQVPGATMPSRVPNTIKAVQGKPLVDFTDPSSGAGYKVGSFHRNLMGDLDWATNDTWVGKFAGKPENFFGNKANYLATDARIRQVARNMGWSTAEVQETVWSFIKTLMEQTPRSSTLVEGLKGLTHELIAKDPDFSTLLRDPEIARELERVGLQPPAEVRGAGVQPPAPAIPGGEEEADPRVLARTARRLQRQGFKPIGAATKP